MFKNLKLSQQLGWGFAAVLMLLALVSATSFWAISSAENSLLSYEQSAEESGSAWEEQADVEMMRMAILNNLQTHDHKYIDEAHEIAKELMTDFEARLAAATTTEEQETIKEMMDDVKLFEESFGKIAQLWDERQTALAPMIAEGGNMVALMDEVVGDFAEANRADLLALAAQAQKDLLSGQLYVVKYLEDPSEANYNTGYDALSDAELGTVIAKLSDQVRSAEIKDDFVQFEKSRSIYIENLKTLHDVLTERKEIINFAVFELAPEVSHDLELLKEKAMKHQTELGLEAEEATHFSVLLIAALSLFALVTGALISYVLPRAIRKPIGGEPREIQALTERIAEGDLTVEFSRTGTETGIYAALRDMSDKLATIVSDVDVAAGTVSSASGQIAAGSKELSQRTEEQASSLEETAASIEEMTSTVKGNADNAQSAAQLAEGARDRAAAGETVVKQAQGAMQSVAEASAAMQEIIEVIEGIAFQTNLLSLNASVEAARAGEQGRGFAVVAGEVGKLASKSSDAAKEIKGLIGSTSAKVENGVSLVQQTGESLASINEAVNKVNDIIAEIAAASQEQAAGISQVNKAVTQMDEVTQHNASLVEETAAASEALSEQAVHLKEMMGYFQVTANARQVKPQAAPAKRAEKEAPAKSQPAPRSKATKEEKGWEKF